MPFIPISDTTSTFKPISRSVQRDAPQKADADDLKLQKISKDFESIFVFYLLETMNSTVLESDPLEKGSEGDYFRSSLNQEIAKQISHRGDIGLWKMIYNDLKGKVEAQNESKETEDQN